MYQLKELFIEVTNCCFQYCVHCSSYAIDKNYPEIQFKDLKRVVDQALPLGLQNVTLSGGEPFLYGDLYKALEYFTHKNLLTSIYTCGVIKDSQGNLSYIGKDIFEKFKNKNLNKIIFSLHGASSSTQDNIANTNGSFNFVMQSLDNAQHAGINIELHVVPMRSNLYDLEDILKIAIKKKIQQVSFLRFVPQGRGDLSMEPTKEQYRILMEKYKIWKKKYSDIKIRFGTPYNCLTLEGKRCTAGIDKLLITANGEYFPCEAFKYLKGTRNSIYNTDIVDFWAHDVLMNELRSVSVDNISVCNTCPNKDLCRAGCAGQRLRRNGSLMKGPDSSCLMR